MKSIRIGDTILVENHETQTTEPFKVTYVLKCANYITLLDGKHPSGLTLEASTKVLRLKSGIQFMAITGRSLEAQDVKGER
jgi:hypothetical protein